jgi:DNA-nicking Smr family endonuclease
VRLLTLCSTAANNNRLYDKSAIHRLNDCTAWINRAKEAVAKALVLAARNTRLNQNPAVLDLHYMDRDKARDVVWQCLAELQRNLQSGQLNIVVGRGSHSHNRRSNLKPEIIEVLESMSLEYSCPEENEGVISVIVRP